MPPTGASGSLSPGDRRPLSTEDLPSGCSPVLAELVLRLSHSPEKGLRDGLDRRLMRLPATARPDRDAQRSLDALDWMFRTYAPAWLGLAGLVGEARQLEGLPRLLDATACDRAQQAVVNALASAQRDASRTSEEMRMCLEGVSGPEDVGTAWNESMEAVEEIAKGPWIVSFELAVCSAARVCQEELSDRAGWSLAVSVSDLAAQSAAWRSARDRVEEAVALAVRGEDWKGAASQAKSTARQALAPTVSRLSEGTLSLIDRLSEH